MRTKTDYITELLRREPYTPAKDMPTRMKHHARGLRLLNLNDAEIETLLKSFCRSQGFGVRPEMLAEAIRP